MRATVDGDALNVANTLAAGDAPDQLAPELLAFVQAHGSAVSPSQYASALIGRAGVAMRPTIAAMAGVPDAVSQLERTTPANDSVLDAARLPDGAAAAPSSSQGMIFWYYVLASRIDDTQAWSAVAHWTGDSLSQSVNEGAQCLDAKVGAGDADGAAAMLAAFQSWASLAPAESITTVAPIDGNEVAIRACDPGAVLTAPLPTKVPVAVRWRRRRASVGAGGDQCSGADQGRRQLCDHRSTPARDVVDVTGRRRTGVRRQLATGLRCCQPRRGRRLPSDHRLIDFR